MPYKNLEDKRRSSRESYYRNKQKRLANSNAFRDRKGPAYSCWIAMRQRCNNSNNPDYPRYGGRGITICQEWDSFETFLHDIGPRLDKTYEIERIDNNGNYEPNNVRWATSYEQSQNTSRTKLITHNGETKSLRAWGRKLNVHHQKVEELLRRADI